MWNAITINKTKINFRILETIDAYKSIHKPKENDENDISIKELLSLEKIYGNNAAWNNRYNNTHNLLFWPSGTVDCTHNKKKR